MGWFFFFPGLLSVKDTWRKSCAKFLQFGMCFMTILISDKMFSSPGLAFTLGWFPALISFPLLGDSVIILTGSCDYRVQGDVSGIQA